MFWVPLAFYLLEIEWLRMLTWSHHLAATGTQNPCHQLKPNPPLLATSPQANLGNSFNQTSCSAFPLQRCTVEMLKHCPCPQNKTHLAVKLDKVCSATQKMLPDTGERTLKPAQGYLYGAPDLTKPKPSMPDQLAILTTSTTLRPPSSPKSSSQVNVVQY